MSSENPAPEPPPEKKYRVRIWLKWGAGYYDFPKVPDFRMAVLAQQMRGSGGFLDDHNWIPMESILGVALVEEVNGQTATVVPFRPELRVDNTPSGDT